MQIEIYVGADTNSYRCRLEMQRARFPHAAGQVRRSMHGGGVVGGNAPVYIYGGLTSTIHNQVNVWIYIESGYVCLFDETLR